MSEPRVRIDGTGSYLPGEAVGIQQVESILGPLDGLPDRLAGRVDKFRDRLLSRSGVERRHFAIDPVDRRQTETNASLAEKAARQALQAAKTEADEIDLLICSNCAADCFTPPTSALIQERLGIHGCTEIEIHSNCTGVPKSLQIALDMLRQGRYRKALVIYTQLSSIFLRSEFYNPAKVTLEHITLRWMLSDGGGAMVLSLADGDEPCQELIDAYVESVGCGQAPGMKMLLGGECGPELAHLPMPFLHSLHESGMHHLWQDVARVSAQGAEDALNGLRNMLDACGVSPDEVATFVLPFPGRHFIHDKHRELFDRVIGPPAESRVPFLVSEFGYCGGASSLVQFDYMARNGSFRPDDLIAVYVEESSKWMSGGFLARWA